MARFVIRMNDALGVVDRAIVRMPCSFYERHCAVAVGLSSFHFSHHQQQPRLGKSFKNTGASRDNMMLYTPVLWYVDTYYYYSMLLIEVRAVAYKKKIMSCLWESQILSFPNLPSRFLQSCVTFHFFSAPKARPMLATSPLTTHKQDDVVFVSKTATKLICPRECSEGECCEILLAQAIQK